MKLNSRLIFKTGMFLVLLDINGILGVKTDTKPENQEYISCRSYYFIIRPNIREFLTKLREFATVGIFSSTNYTNVAAILSVIDPEFKKTFTPLMDRSMTAFDPNTKGVETVKNLDIFWSNPVHNSNRKWNSGNTLLIDDDYSKVRFNDEKNILVVNENDDLDLLLRKIREKIV